MTPQSLLTYFRSQEVFWDPPGITVNEITMCDFLEDFRSNTVLDVIGSVGGLFALFQAAHVLLFRRPLIWALIGQPISCHSI
jgi:hypothetical protein